MSNNQISDFLSILDSEKSNPLSIKIPSTGKNISLEPLTFKQQKALITTRLDGIAGVMNFIKTLNNILVENTGNDSLKIQDRLILALNLRKTLNDEPIKKGDVEIKIDDILKRNIEFPVSDEVTIEGKGYEITLQLPTLKEESKIITLCIAELEKIEKDKLGQNISLILSYEIPKFIDNIKFGDKVVNFSDINIKDKQKIVDSLPANITTDINKYILSIRKYEEDYLTIGDTTVEIDAEFFE